MTAFCDFRLKHCEVLRFVEDVTRCNHFFAYCCCFFMRRYSHSENHVNERHSHRRVINSRTFVTAKIHCWCVLDSMDIHSLWYELNTLFTTATLNGKRLARIFPPRSFTWFEFYTQRIAYATNTTVVYGKWYKRAILRRASKYHQPLHFAFAIEESLTNKSVEVFNATTWLF